MSGSAGMCSAMTLVGQTRKSRASDARSSTASSTAIAPFRSISRTSIRLHAVWSQRIPLDSDHNFEKAEHFHNEALRMESGCAAPEALQRLSRPRYAALQAQLAERDAALDRLRRRLLRSGPLHQTTHEEKWGLNLFRLMATWLIEAHIAGRSDRPEFAEMRDMAKDVTDAIQRGNLSAATATSRRKKRGLKCSWPRSIVPEILARSSRRSSS